ncbi:ATP-binding protein [Pseudoalteromonas sp. OOF1S-7]|uniref:ATP-binding protein n=1 Tax=Pseudoalteromonas sp. OOF1S-7 TaxID=2917757 RepID=UPI001EF45010|nr:ATP-binding protein [Pseudoalteromonas sp. OOF1S-7]MCG7537472.1 ATP-binding protein [Pseudoalteromonas sp. OOF1S-7]
MQTIHVLSSRKAFLTRFMVGALLLVILVAGWYIDDVNERRLIEVEKNRTFEELNVYRTQLEGTLASNIQLVRGLAIALAPQPNLNQAQFERFAAPLFETSQVLRNVGAAPDMVLQMVYPLEGNEKAIGLNYLTHPQQKKDAIRARDSRTIILAGPLELVQGGVALIARVPVYVDKDRFWGLLSVVIDMPKLYEQVSLNKLEGDYLIAIQGRNGLGDSGEYFYGSPTIQEHNPLAFTIQVPSGSWVMYAAPRYGWKASSAALWPFRLALLTIVLFFLFAFSFYTRLLSELKSKTSALTNMGSLAKVGAWSVDLATHQITLSEVTRQIFAVPHDYQPTWMSSTEFFKEGQHRKKFQDHMNQAIKYGKPFEDEFVVLPHKGQECWVLIKAQAKQQNGWTLQVFGSVQNINDRKLMAIEHEKVARNNELLAQLSTHEAILNNHTERAQELCTDAVCQAARASRASIWLLSEDHALLYPTCFSNTRRDSLQHFPPWRKATLPGLFSAVLSKQVIEASMATKHPITRPLADQYLDPFEVEAMLIMPILHRGAVCGILCTEYGDPYPDWTDSDRRFIQAIAAMLASLFSGQQQQQAKRKAIIEKELAEQSAKIKADFLASMSHEIRTPMNGIIGMLEILGNSQLTDTQQRNLALAQSSAESLLTIINDILDFSKIEAGKLNIEQIECDLIQIISDCFAAFAPRANDQQTELFIDSRNMQYQHAKTDPHRLKQILNNLISNAVKFTENGKVTLTCYTERTSEQSRLWCSVEDTGIGISKQQLSKIFDSFTQADPSTTRKFGGTGLGLTIARQLCELMGGALNAYSKPSLGSTFTFYIELNDPQPIRALDTNNDSLYVIDAHSPSDLAARHMLDAWHIPTEHFESVAHMLEAYDANTLQRPALIIATEVLTSTPESDINSLLKHIKTKQLSYALLCHNMAQTQAWPQFSSNNVLLAPLTPANALSLVKRKEPLAAKTVEEVCLDVDILLVEDNKINQTVATTLLEKLGAHVTCAHNGLAAIGHLKVRDEPYAIILMDCQMPEMDGYTATREIRAGIAGEQHQQTPIIALTANAMEGDEEKCLAAGMDAYLSKPINFAALSKMLQRWVDEAKTC